MSGKPMFDGVMFTPYQPQEPRDRRYTHVRVGSTAAAKTRARDARTRALLTFAERRLPSLEAREQLYLDRYLEAKETLAQERRSIQRLRGLLPPPDGSQDNAP